MPRIAGIDIPEKKRVDIGLTYVYGLGRANVKVILSQTGGNPSKIGRASCRERV